MPRYGGYGGYAQPQSAPGYDPYSKNFQWGTAFSGIQEIIQQLAMMKQMKKQGEEEEKEKTWKRDVEEQKLGLEIKRLKLEQDAAAQKAKEPPKLSAAEQAREWRKSHARQRVSLPEGDPRKWTEDEGIFYYQTGKTPTREQIDEEAQKAQARAKAAGTGRFAEKETPAERVKRIREEARAGAEGREDAKPPDVVDPSKTAPARQANQAMIGSFYKDNDLSEPGKVRKHMENKGYLKGDKYTRPIGGPDIALDMPPYYSIAKANIRDGVATPKDIEVVEKADKTAEKFFKELKSRKPKKGELLALFANNPEIDMNVLLMLAEIYR